MEHESASHIRRNSRSDLSGVRHFSNVFMSVIICRNFPLLLPPPPHQVPREKRARLKDKDIIEIRDTRERERDFFRFLTGSRE